MLLILVLFTCILLVNDILNSFNRKDILDLIVYSFIFVYGFLRVAHLLASDVVPANFYIFGPDTDVPWVGVYIYAFSYLIFFSLYRIFSVKNDYSLTLFQHQITSKNNAILFLTICVFLLSLRLNIQGAALLDVAFVSMIIILYNNTKASRSVLGYLIFTTFLIIYFSESNERRDVLFLIFTLLYLGWANTKLSQIFSHVLVLIIAFFVMVGLAIFMRSGFDIPSVTWNIILRLIEVELDYSIVTDTTAYAMNEVYSEGEYLFSFAYLKPIFYLIPREIFPDKPLTFSREVASVFFTGFFNAGGSTPTGIMGEAFLNFGFLGVLLFSIVFITTTNLIKKLTTSQSAFVSAGAVSVSVSMFYILRGPIDTVMLYYIALIFFQVCISLLPKKKCK